MWHLLQNDPLVIRKRQNITFILFFKTLIGLLLPSRQAQKVLNFAKKSS